jgi:Protein of unknown function (DUF3352)
MNGRLPAGTHLQANACCTYDPRPVPPDRQKGPDALSLAPSRTRPTRRRPRLLAVLRRGRGVAVLTVLAAAPLAGCGSSHSSGAAADPALATPAAAPLFAGATVRPTGAQKAAALAVGRTLTHQANPYLRLVALLQTPGSPALSFSHDLAPWLGQRAGIFATSLGSSSRAQNALVLSLVQQGLLGASSATGSFPFGSASAQGAIVLDTTDPAKARSFLASQAQHAGAHASAYRGVAYRVSAGGVAFGLIGRFAVIGSESGIRGAIETTQGGAALAHASGYAKLLASAPSGALAHIYANGTVAGASGSGGLPQLLVGARETNISLVPSSGSVAIDADVLASGSGGGPTGLLGAGVDGGQAFGELPGDSWLALGLGHVGATLGEDVRGLRALAALGSSLEAPGTEARTSVINLKGLLEGLLRPLSLLGAEGTQAKRDFASWMGSGGIFASGANLLELKGAVVIASNDPARSRAAVGKLAAQLRAAGSSVLPATIAGTDASVGARLTGLPVVLDIADGRDSSGHTKFVLGLGEASVTAALNPPSTLAGAASTSAASGVLGEGIHPNLIVEVPTLLSLLEGVGLTEDPTLSKVLPFLRSVTTLAGGTHSLGGGVERVRVVTSLR